MTAPLRIAGPLLMAILLGGCPQKKDDAPKEEAAVPVEVAEVQRGPIEAAYRGTATLEAEEEAVVVAKTSGVIEQILVEEGQRVKAGQPLARLETNRLRLEAARAKANLDKLEQDYRRNESVYERKLIAREVYERSKFERDAAKAAYELARLSLQESEIRAPFDGVVSARHIKIGNTISAGAPAFQVTRMDRLQAEIYVPERDIGKLAAGQVATLNVDAWPQRSFRGRIERVNPVVDAQTGTVKVTVAVAPGQPELKPGMFGRVQILYDRREDAVLVPRDAVLSEDAAMSAFVVMDGKAQRRPLKIGYANGAYYEVLEGLSGGERVVVTGQANLRDAARVQVVQEDVGGTATATAQALEKQ